MNVIEFGKEKSRLDWMNSNKIFLDSTRKINKRGKRSFINTSRRLYQFQEKIIDWFQNKREQELLNYTKTRKFQRNALDEHIILLHRGLRF